MQKIIALIVVLAAIGIGFYYFSNTASGPEESSNTASDETMLGKDQGATMEKKANDMMESEKMGENMMKDGESMMAKKITVTYGTNEQFNPASISIKKGERVTWKNDSTVFFWPASAIHPTHQIYPEFDAKKGTAPSGEWSFTFDKVGTWKYHDHLKPTAFGTVIVTE